MELNIIWCLKSDTEIEFSRDWILEVFSKFEIKEHFDRELNFNIRLDNSLIVVSNVSDQNKLIEYLKSINDTNYSMLHLSDEIFNHDVTFYKYAKKVIRTLYSDKYTELYNTITIPVGYKSGTGKVESEKKYLFNFIGQIKSDRSIMINTFKDTNPNFIYLTNQWDDPRAIINPEYSMILSESYFTLCPRGWDGTPIESFRLSESLQCGSIPVSILDNGRDYFKLVFGDNHPFIVGDNWVDAFNKVKCVNNLQDKLDEVQDWWINFKHNLQNRMLNLYSIKNIKENV